MSAAAEGSADESIFDATAVAPRPPDDCLEFQPGEEAALEALRGLLGDELLSALPEDISGRLNLIRFLRGHGCKPKEAEKYYRAMVAWRESNGMVELRALTAGKDLAYESLPGGEHVRRFVTMRLHAGWSRSGHLVQLGCPGKMAIPELMGAVGVAGFERFWHSMLEIRHQLMARESEARGHVVKVAMVRDLTGIGMHLLTADARKLLVSLVKGAQDNFPESMHRIAFINTPAFFSFIMTILRPLLNKRTLEKFMVVGADWVPPLLGVLDVSVLRELVLMGQAGTAEEGCHEAAAAGAAPRSRELGVGARDSTTLRLSLAPGATCRFSFWLASGDIDFTATAFEDRAGTDVVPTERCAAAADEGALKAGEFTATHEHGAILQLRWGNGHSWMTSKTVTCTTEVTLAST